MSNRNFAIFETAIGPCGIAWSDLGVVAVQLPTGTREVMRVRMKARVSNASEDEPPPAIARAIADVVALTNGERRDLTGVVIDDREISEFNRRVYAIVRQIPAGRTMTYGEVAARLGDKSLSRAVGRAMGENPTPIIMPCHRVLAANGKSGGFSAPGGAATKMRLLTIEGAAPGGPDLFGDLPLAVAPRGRRR